jgi:hypothetical protein
MFTGKEGGTREAEGNDMMQGWLMMAAPHVDLYDYIALPT